MLNKSKSLTLTGILVKVVFVALIAALFCIPICVEWYCAVSHAGGATGLQVESAYLPLMIICYLSVGIAFPLIITLDRLVSNIKKHEIFITANVKLLHIMSYCCFAISLLWAVMAAFRLLAVVVFVAAAFFGLILRVIKSVFEEAVSIREENDATI
ncbi:MAG: DUF2975 domain-containing protein [Ruminococcus sp.]|nr:DUF2975 domain-containing protein [Ruminococcus sp.]